MHEGESVWRRYFADVRDWTTWAMSATPATVSATDDQLRALGVLKGVPKHRRILLATMVCDIDAHKDWDRSDAPTAATARQVRKLAAKVGALERSFAAVSEYAAFIEQRNPGLAEALNLQFDAFYTQLGVIGEAIRDLRYPGAVLDDGEAQPEVPEPDFGNGAIQVALHDFFVSGCGLSSNEAQIRTTKIGNHFWNWDNAVREKAESIELRRGSDAVRKAVSRAKRR